MEIWHDQNLQNIDQFTFDGTTTPVWMKREDGLGHLYHYGGMEEETRGLYILRK